MLSGEERSRTAGELRISDSTWNLQEERLTRPVTSREFQSVADQPQATSDRSRPSLAKSRMANAEPWRSMEDPDMVVLFSQFLDPDDSVKPSLSADDSVKPSLSEKSMEPILYSLRDHDQKSLYLYEEKLVAAPLQGSNAAHEEVLSVLPNQFLERTKFPLILGVRGGKQGLSCGKDDEPKLQLEDCNLKDLFHNDMEAKRFTFFKDFNGRMHTFESAAYPKWFLCSSVEAHQPLAVTNSPGGTAITTFYFQRK